VTGEHFQELAQQMGVEALVIGSVTDFDAYYPPRMAMTVHWYAANAGFHPIPNGYGLPWGTQQEEDIPARIVRDKQFDMARSQLSTQTPAPDASRQTNLLRDREHRPNESAIALASGELEALPADGASSLKTDSNGNTLPGQDLQGDYGMMQGNQPAAATTLAQPHRPHPRSSIARTSADDCQSRADTKPYPNLSRR